MGLFSDIKKLKWKDIDPNNKNGALAGNLRDLDKQVLQPLEQAALVASFVSIPFAGPLAAAYIAGLFAQNVPHQALPLWFKIACKDLNMYSEIDLTKVSYQENVKGVDGGITIGYNIFFSYDLQLDRPHVNYEHLRHLLHELQHVVQYEKGGGIGPVLSKIIIQYGGEALAQVGKLTDGASLRNIHDDAAMEQEADRVRDENIDRVWAIMNSIKELGEAPRRRVRFPPGPPGRPGHFPMVPPLQER